MPRASGSRPHSAAICAMAGSAGSRPGRAASRASSPAASPGASVSRLMTRASSSAVRCRRLVISTRAPPVPGSSGRTWSLPAASSSTNSSRCPDTRSRHRLARDSGLAGICAGAIPVVCSKVASASPGRTGCCPAVCACSGRKTCPSGKCGASWRAARTANAVLPTPAIPPITQMPPAPAPASSWASSPARPVNEAISRGSARLAAATPAPRSRPPAAARNPARSGPVSPSASASSRAVWLRAVRLMPRSRSLTVRVLSAAARASSCWLSPALVRNRRSSCPNAIITRSPVRYSPRTDPAARPSARRAGLPRPL